MKCFASVDSKTPFVKQFETVEFTNLVVSDSQQLVDCRELLG